MTLETLPRPSEAPPEEPPPSRWGLVLAVLLLAALALTVAGVFPLRQLADQRRTVAEARARLAALEAERRGLEAEIAALETDAELERLAREELGYVRPGEVGYVVVTPPVDVADVEGPPAPSGEEGDPWWARLWRFLTGADVVADG